MKEWAEAGADVLLHVMMESVVVGDRLELG